MAVILQIVCGRLRSCPLDLHHFCFLEHAQMPAQIAIRQGAQLLEIAEGQAFRIGQQRGQHTKARALMNHAIQALVCETAFSGWF